MSKSTEISAENEPIPQEGDLPASPELRLEPHTSLDGKSSPTATSSVAVPDLAERSLRAAESAEKSEPNRQGTRKSQTPRRKPVASTGFAPSDINDGRERYDWESKYEKIALDKIAREKWYLFVLLYGIPLGMFLTYVISHYLNDTYKSANYLEISHLVYAWLGGMLGGTLFDLKWLYHSVAKGLWHQDRSLWRFFTPHLSGALAFSFVLLISSNLIRLFDQGAFTSSKAVVAVAFLVGYFSDSAIAKLTELTETLFGTIKKTRDKVAEEGKSNQATASSVPQTGLTKARSSKTK